MIKKKILVVEDDPEVRLALQIRLRANSYEVVLAVDGISAIAETRKHMPDLILLDLGLPAGDGFVVLERLQSMYALASIPVVVVSGRDRAANIERVQRAGSKAFLQKPTKSSELLFTIDRLLNTERSPSTVVYELGHNASATC